MTDTTGPEADAEYIRPKTPRKSGAAKAAEAKAAEAEVEAEAEAGAEAEAEATCVDCFENRPIRVEVVEYWDLDDDCCRPSGRAIAATLVAVAGAVVGGLLLLRHLRK